MMLELFRGFDAASGILMTCDDVFIVPLLI